MNLLNHGPCHGYELVQRMKTIEGLKIREGNVYPILARLQAEKLVESYTEPSADGPPRKYFKVTVAGQQTLADINTHWEQMVDSIQQVQRGSFL